MSAKSRSWTAVEIDEQQVVHRWRSMRAQTQQENKHTEQIFPLTGANYHRLRLFHHCVVALWEHACRDYAGQNDVRAILIEITN